MYQQQLVQLKTQLENEQWDSAADGVENSNLSIN